MYAFGIEDWFGIVNMRIQRPRIRRELTALKDWEPPDTCATAKVRPCVGRTLFTRRGIQSIWFLNTAVFMMMTMRKLIISLWNRSETGIMRGEASLRGFHAAPVTPRHGHHSTNSRTEAPVPSRGLAEPRLSSGAQWGNKREHHTRDGIRFEQPQAPRAENMT